MKCTKCGNEMRLGSEEYCKDVNGDPMYKNFAYCDSCQTKVELNQTNYAQTNQAPKKKKNGCLTAILIVVLIFVILAVIGAAISSSVKTSPKNTSTPEVESTSEKENSSNDKKNTKSSSNKSDKNDESDNSKYITMEEFNKIKTGMSYKKVKKIVGSSGEVTSEVESNGIKIVMITWYGNGTLGSNANVTFTNGSVTAKAQFGLQ